MRQTEPVVEDSGGVRDVRDLRLTALLHRKGNRNAAAELVIDPGLSPRV